MLKEILPFKGELEIYPQNAFVKNKTRIEGWALDGSGIQSVYIISEGKREEVSYGIKKDYIDELYPSYKNSFSGYAIDYDTSNFIGNKTISLNILTNEGITHKTDILLKRETSEILYEIENLEENLVVGKNRSIEGWVSSVEEIEYLKLFIDSKEIVFDKGIERNDIMNRFPTRTISNIGWSIPKESIPKDSGNYLFEMKIKEKNKEEYVKSINFKIPKYNTIYEVEHPVDSSNLADITLISGYYLSDKGLKSVSVSINDKITKEGNINIYREDIYKNYKEYANQNAGWEIEVDTSSLNAGNYSMSIQFIDNEEPLKARTLKSQGNSQTLNVKKTRTPWFDVIEQGDIPSKVILLDEIKANLIDVITDYKGLGIEDEDLLISKTISLFTSEIIPDRNDWNNISSILKELATIKEKGEEYKNFIDDLDDGLGVTDLYKIKEFINYIQELGPVKSITNIVMELPPKYEMKSTKHSSPDNYKKTIVLEWDVNPIVNKNATITYPKNIVEDVNSYNFIIDSGNFHKEMTVKPSAIAPIVFKLEWNKWYDSESVKEASITTSHYVIDKRGNSSEYDISIKSFPQEVLIPIGVDYYIVEYSLNKSPWTVLAKTTSKTYTHKIPENSGPTQYRIKAIDKNNKLETNYIYTSTISLDFLPPLPKAPNPVASPDYNHINVTWKAIQYADYYEIYIGNSLENAKKKTGWYYKTTSLKAIMKSLAENTTYKITVLAGNRRGSSQKSINSKTKKRMPKTLNIKPLGHKVYREAYRTRYPWGYANWVGPAWRKDTTDIMQAEWVETWPEGWAWRSNGLYQAYKGQAWGNNRTCVIFKYADIVKVLKGKKITEVEIALRRTSTIHGWPTGNPIHMCNHNETSIAKTGGRPSMFNLKTSNKSVARGNYVYVKDGNTKFLLQQIVDGKAKGMGFFKNYPGKTPEGDKAYLRFGKDFSIKVTYYDA